MASAIMIYLLDILVEHSFEPLCPLLGVPKRKETSACGMYV